MENNNVEHPSHYNREGAMECIDEMRLIFGDEAVAHFCLLNAWKYRYRAADKNGEEDLKKSDWYLQKYKEIKIKKLTCDDCKFKELKFNEYPCKECNCYDNFVSAYE